jgi:methionyl aminopeptidase
MIVRTDIERAKVRASGKILAQVLDEVARATVPGVTSVELNLLTERLIREKGATPIFLNYQPDGENRPYPAVICLSVNDMVVHGIPNEHEFTIADGDIVSIDSGVTFDGVVTDATRTVIAGKADPEDERFLAAAEEALAVAIKTAKTGARVGDVSAAIEAVARKYGYGVPIMFGGHGVGARLHEDPFIANVGKRGTGPVLEEGLVIAIEPIFTRGKPGIIFNEEDGYEARTRDHSRAVQVEHTVIVGKDGGEVVTRV